jgi:membrane protease YdiL (CAAX protease family)
VPTRNATKNDNDTARSSVHQCNCETKECLQNVALIGESLAYFLGGALATFVAVHIGIPFLSQQCGISPLIAWFLTSGVLMAFFFCAALAAARRQTGSRSFTGTLNALRLHRPNRTDLAWTVGGLGGVALLTGAIVTVFSHLFTIDLLSKESYASFLQLTELEPTEYWIFLVWLPYFFFNIAGEELLWRGYLLPRQVLAIGSSAWILNGLLWAIFHLAIGWRIAVVLLPIEAIVPYVVQRRQNTWLGVLIHGAYNGSAFILVALGVVE